MVQRARNNVPFEGRYGGLNELLERAYVLRQAEDMPRLQLSDIKGS